MVVGYSSTIFKINSVRWKQNECVTCSTNQQSTRAKNCTALGELLGDSGSPHDASEAVSSGLSVFLPSKYIGGECYMRQEMRHIIATSDKMGYPDIFLTITCNSNWKEIRRSLLLGKSPQDRPDLCARVFNLKLKALMEVVIKDKIFGEVLAHVRDRVPEARIASCALHLHSRPSLEELTSKSVTSGCGILRGAAT